MGALVGLAGHFFSVGGRRPGQIGDTVLRPRSEEKDVEPGPSQPSWETQACCSLPACLPAWGCSGKVPGRCERRRGVD